MPKLHPIALSVICALTMGGCASPMQKQADRPPAVQPVLNVTHGVTADGLYRLGRYFEGQARYDAAIDAYRETIKRDPLMVEAYTGLGMSLAAQQRYDDAVRQLQAAIVLAPQVAHLHNNLGYAYLLGGQTEQAVKALEEARRLDPAHARSAENLRIAQAKLPGTIPQAVASQSTTPVVQAITTPSAGARLVEVAPQVFELKMPPEPRSLEQIHAVPLPPLPPQQPRAMPTRSFKLEVSNGNGVLGLAKRVADRLTGAGVRTARLTNQLPFDQPTTEMQYREGYAAEAAALAAKLQHPVQVKPNQDLASHIDVRLVLGRDVLSDVALGAPPSPATATKIAGR
jgi:tetratricopeptide (TPR) repeat protein